jgi:ribA/ribD-fused uncharacterized protein
LNLLISTKEALVEYVNHGNRVKYVFFWGHQGNDSGTTKTCFSQWYESVFEYEGNRFMTAEHFMMYQKAQLFGDSIAAQRLLSAGNPGQAKAIGREVQGFNEETWLAHRFEIVVSTNIAKFGANSDIREFLLNTGNRVLVEASPVDKIWGIGLAEDNPACQNPNLWKGENLLGFALMEARDQLS